MNEPTLRALTIGELLDKSFSIYRRNFPLLISITAAVLIPVALLQLLGILFLGEFQSAGSIPGSLLQIWGQLALIVAISNINLGKDASFRAAYASGGRKYWSLFGAELLISLAIGIPFGVVAYVAIGVPLLGIFILVLALPFIVYVYTRWSLVSAAMVNEDIGAKDSLARSWTLTDGYFWKVFSTSFMASLLALLIAYLPNLFATFLLVRIVGASQQMIQIVDLAITQIAVLITMPFTVAVVVLIYFDLRIRKEGYDLQLMADQIGALEHSSTTPS